MKDYIIVSMNVDAFSSIQFDEAWKSPMSDIMPQSYAANTEKGLRIAPKTLS